jgi:Tfp pilus assembly PilM family ATPase
MRIGIDLSDTQVYVAKVSYFGRILELQERKMPLGLVADDKVKEPEQLNVFLRKHFFSEQRSLRSRVAILIPESRIFRSFLSFPKEKKILDKDRILSLAQKDIPFLLSSASVTMGFSSDKETTQVAVEAAEREVIENLKASVPQEQAHLTVIEAHSYALLHLMRTQGFLPNGFVGFIDISKTWVTLTLFKKQQIVYSRTVRIPVSFLEKQGMSEPLIPDFVTNLLDETVLYYQERHAIIDYFVVSADFFLEESFRKSLKAWKGGADILFIDDALFMKEQKKNVFFLLPDLSELLLP